MGRGSGVGNVSLKYIIVSGLKIVRGPLQMDIINF